MAKKKAGPVAKIVSVLVALFFIGSGGYDTWLQHSGPAATVQVESCKASTRSGIYTPRTCKATWHRDGTTQTLTVEKVPRGQASNTHVDVRIHGNKAYGPSLSPLVDLLVGIALAAVISVVFVRGARARDRRTVR